MKTIVFNHSLSHTHNHMRHTEHKHTPHTPPCTKLSVPTSQWITILQNKAKQSDAKPCCKGEHSSKGPTTDVHIPNASENRPRTILKKGNIVAVWACWSRASFKRRLSSWALTKAARLHQSNPKAPQLCSFQKVSDVTAAKYRYHDDTAEPAELAALWHHSKMMTVFSLDSWWKPEFHHIQTTTCTAHFYSASTTFSFVLLSITA